MSFSFFIIIYYIFYLRSFWNKVQNKKRECFFSLNKGERECVDESRGVSETKYNHNNSSHMYYAYINEWKIGMECI